MRLDDLSPPNVRQPLVKLELVDPFARLLAFAPVELAVSLLGEAVTVGLVAPVELTVMPPSGDVRNFYRHVFRGRRVPETVTFPTREGGMHLVRLAEVGHNLWFGTLEVLIDGDKLTT
jgi:hypothetical protein